MDFLSSAASDTPHFPAFEALTFLELEHKTQQLEQVLIKHGVQPGDRVAVHLETGPEFIALLFATLRLGALFCPLSLRLSSIQPQLERLQPKLCFTKNGCQVFPDCPPSTRRSEVLLFTSGTTGTPKIACIPHTSLQASAVSAVQTVDLRPHDAWALTLPLYHVGGLGIVFRCLHARACMTTSLQNITHISCVPTQLYRAWPVSKRLRCVLLGGAPITDIPKELPIVCSYGMTETASMVLADGLPLPGKEVKLIDGEIWVRGNSMFSGYWGEPLHAGWFATKDLGRLENNRYIIAGRKDRQFISGGENIQPEEIEQALLQHPNILEAVVQPKSDPEYGVRPIAFVRTLESLTLTSLHQFLSPKLPKYKWPAELSELPKNVHTKLLT